MQEILLKREPDYTPIQIFKPSIPYTPRQFQHQHFPPVKLQYDNHLWSDELHSPLPRNPISCRILCMQQTEGQAGSRTCIGTEIKQVFQKESLACSR